MKGEREREREREHGAFARVPEVARELYVLHEDHFEEDLVVARVEGQAAAHHLVPAAGEYEFEYVVEE